MFTITKTEETNMNDPQSWVYVQTSYGHYNTEIMHRISPRSWDWNRKLWRIQLNSCGDLIRIATLYNISIPEHDLRTYLIGNHYDQAKVQRAERIRDRLAHVELKYPYEFKIKPYPHQIEAFNYGVMLPWMLIGDEQGLGKTSTSAWIADYRYQAHLIRKCLIVCGVNSVKYNWLEEIHKATNQDAIIFDQAGDTKKLKAIEEWAHNDVLFGIINIEALRCSSLRSKDIRGFLSGRTDPADLPISPVTKRLNEIADMTIVDEIHKAKTPTSKQGVALRQLQSKYRIGLSGTPLTNQILDLWNILSWLGAETHNYWAFRDKYSVTEPKAGVVAYKDLTDLRRETASIMLRRKKDEVLNLPEKIYTTEYIELSRDQKKLYLDAREGILKKLDTLLPTDNPLTMILRLRQITSGLLTSEAQNGKLQRIKSMLEDDIIPNGHKAIIFTCWAEEAKLYKEALAEYNPAFIIGETKPAERQRQVNLFQSDPDCKIIIGTIGAMGTGLTLTAATYVFFIDKAWNDTDNIQAEDRAHRIGTKSNVEIITVLAKDTVDEKIEEKLSLKSNIFASLINGDPATGKFVSHHISNKQLLRELLDA